MGVLDRAEDPRENAHLRLRASGRIAGRGTPVAGGGFRFEASIGAQIHAWSRGFRSWTIRRREPSPPHARIWRVRRWSAGNWPAASSPTFESNWRSQYEEQKLRLAERRFSSAVEAFRARRDLLSRVHGCGSAVRSTAVDGRIVGELTDLARAFIAPEEKIERMQAKATAIDELLSSGALEI